MTAMVAISQVKSSGLGAVTQGKDLRYGIIELTQGNINNDHLYLTSIMDLFPITSVGGSSEADRASQLLEVHSALALPC